MYRFCYLSLFLLFTVSTIFADANKSVGSGGDYEDLTAAFTAINSGQITGVIVLRLTTSTALSAYCATKRKARVVPVICLFSSILMLQVSLFHQVNRLPSN